MKSLLAVVISWNRPHFLRETLDSLFRQSNPADASILVVDNCSEAETVAVIEQETRLTNYRLLNQNRGINGALEAILTEDVLDHHEFLLVSDADMRYQRPLQLAIDLLASESTVGAVSYQHSPEHPVAGELVSGGRTWLTKWSERGCALFLRIADYRRLRPLPVENFKDFDWWVVRDAPQSLQHRNLPLAVLPGGARHLGWRTGDSTWQTTEIPEFDENKSKDLFPVNLP